MFSSPAVLTDNVVPRAVDVLQSFLYTLTKLSSVLPGIWEAICCVAMCTF